jgi:hypothetical protein
MGYKHRLQALWHSHEKFLLLLFLFSSFRLLAQLFFRPGGYLRDYSDLHHYLGFSSTSDIGYYPFVDYWLEWPPLPSWLFVLLYRLSLRLPPWEDHRLWFGALLEPIPLLFEIGNFVLIYLLAIELHPLPTPPLSLAGRGAGGEGGAWERPFLVASLYAALFVPVYALAGFFDAIPLFFMLLGVWLLLRGRGGAAGAAFGFGFAVKLTPVVLLAAGLRSLSRWRDRARHLLAAAFVILATLAPFLALRPEFLWAGLRGVLGRSSWETVWALLEGYYGFGRVGGDRLNPAETDFTIHPATLPWLPITLAFVALGVWIYTRRADYAKPRSVVALSALTIVLLLLYSKGYSPQFLVYLLPFCLLLLPPGRAVLYALLLTFLNFLEQPIYFALFADEHWLLAGVIVARTLLFVALAGEFALLLFDRETARIAKARRWGLAAFTAILLLGAILAVPRLGAAYTARRYQEEPYRPMIGFLRSQARGGEALLFSEWDLYLRFYPYLWRDYNIYRVQADVGDVAVPIGRAAAHGRVWLVEGPEAVAVVAEELGGRLAQSGAYQFPALGSLRYYDSSSALPPSESGATLGGQVKLLGAEVNRAGDVLRLALYWRAVDPPVDASYTVFTHLLDDAGELVAGHDGLPGSGASPTDRWQAGQVVEDVHDIALPRELPAGSYRLTVGMYDAASGQRLPARGYDGRELPGDEVEVGTFSR